MSEIFEIAIIGAGPGGLGAAANAAAHKISHILLERREIGNTIYDYQLRKHVMAEPSKLPLRANVEFQAGTREEVLEGWQRCISDKKINLKKADISEILKEGDLFHIKCSDGSSYSAMNIVLAIGVQGMPRKLGVPGEELPHVSYTLSDPDAFSDMDIFVVGAGDAAIENALALCDKNRVTILNRSDEFSRAKDANVGLIVNAINSGKIKCYYNSAVSRIEKDWAVVAAPEGDVTVKCNHLIARIGCIMPRKFLESCGIQFPNNDPTTPPVVTGRYESNVKGLYLIGALIGYPLIKQAINQGHEVIEHILGNPIEPADEVLIKEKLSPLGEDTKKELAFIRSNLPLFIGLSDPQFRELITESTIHRPTTDTIIFKLNDYTDTFFSIVKGSVIVETPSGKNITLRSGEYFGEIGLISGRRRGATIRAAEDCILLETPRKQILKLVSSVETLKRTLDEKFVFRALQQSLFPDSEPIFLEEIIKKVRFKNFKKGEALLKEGDLGDSLYFIRKGSVKISRKNREGIDITQTYVPAGNYVGEMSLLYETYTTRTATVTAAVACETVVIDKKDFLELLQKNPEAAENVRKTARDRSIENVTQSTTKETGNVLDFIFKEGITDADNVLIIDSDLCVGCDNCEKACAATHNGYSRLDRKGGKSFASIQIPISCRHCENPLCMLDCPPDALSRMSNGEVIIKDSCIGCGNCVRNCPYGVIQLVYDSSGQGFSLLSLLGLKKKDKGTAKAAKCDMCGHLEGGPACVRSCPTGAAMRVHPSTLLRIMR